MYKIISKGKKLICKAYQIEIRAQWEKLDTYVSFKIENIFTQSVVLQFYSI